MVVKCAFMHFSLLVLCIYSKYDMKITQPVNRMYQTIYVPLWTSPTFPHLISTYVLSYMKCTRIFKFLMLIICEYFMSAVASLILHHTILTRLSDQLCLSFKTTIDTFPSFLLRRNAFSFL